jgi:hypothetical protein
LFFVAIAYLVSLAPWLVDKGLLSFVFDGFLYTVLVTIGAFLFPSIFGLTRIELTNFIYKIKTVGRVT